MAHGRFSTVRCSAGGGEVTSLRQVVTDEQGTIAHHLALNICASSPGVLHSNGSSPRNYPGRVVLSAINDTLHV